MPSIDDDKKTFMKALPRSESVGNISMRRMLGWKVERYWKVRKLLKDDGRVVSGRGRGGTVGRAGKV